MLCVGRARKATPLLPFKTDYLQSQGKKQVMQSCCWLCLGKAAQIRRLQLCQWCANIHSCSTLLLPAVTLLNLPSHNTAVHLNLPDAVSTGKCRSKCSWHSRMSCCCIPRQQGASMGLSGHAASCYGVPMGAAQLVVLLNDQF